MKKNKEIFLFGAGAAIDWGGPLTSELSKLIKKYSFPIRGSETTITEYINQKLLENGYSQTEVNFETIINVIEELAIYFSEYNRKKQTPSLIRCFIKNDDSIKTILNFAITNGKRQHGYKIQIPDGINYDFSHPSYKDENPNQFFLLHLLSSILTNITSRISNYSYHTKSHSVIDTKSDESQLFKNWMKENAKENTLRLYTLNYDRVFKVLLDDIGIDCFEGFDTTDTIEDMNGIRADVLRITNDSESNVHYNLHGSIFWKVLPYDNGQLPNPEIVFTGCPELPDNDEISNVEIEKGKPVYLTNIITGYQKAQKSMVTPFKQLHSSFDRDCLNGNKIYIIGYSFGDEHLNECLKIALRYNQKLKVEIVSPNFIKDKIKEKLILTLFQYLDMPQYNEKKISENKYSYFNDKILVYTLKFNEYLKLKKIN
ncbi:SIR2 family protein [Tenacibaculum sp. AHE15PA]|uniref:SIR2 family protein n=1 Tax=unclassified Tenacibaculum TaxID=2635139 RepID=UPI001C4E50B8|nr:MULTISPECIES: SIR2 family protein [unclassified Tenacibaculum]QXP74061.1 SIR2 family protein [Tenacibaculum sp. AHE14PA]QXP75571.1 SIR2 family protein [Tenacibaculum sp. AHE15PA]